MDLSGEIPKTKVDYPVVSFCISSFQRYEALEELIQEILSVRTDKIEVAVCDDKSLDGSIEKIKKIVDSRLKIYVNDENVGSSLNIHDSLDRGNGKYLFYINERDNVDKFKIEELVRILEILEKEDVAFAQCHVTGGNAEKYHIFQEGREALIQFACRIDHPTGYIFKREVWKKIKNRRILFEDQNYGDYPITEVCAIIAKKHKGALIYGDICDLQRRRIDFSEEKSRFHEKRRDKRLWYTPEVIFRELETGQKFLKKIGVEADIREEILTERYTEYLSLCVTDYKKMITDPACTAHYNFYPRQDFLYVFAVSVQNGIKLWHKIILLAIAENKRLVFQINKITQQEYKRYFRKVLETDLHIMRRTVRKLKEKDNEIIKRESALNAYEMWVDALIRKQMISEYLLKKGYRHVAIYGMGRIGKQLWNEFRNSDIKVEFVIDRRISEQTEYYEDVRCFAPESDFPCTDIIIVAVSGEASQIINELRRKVNCPVKSLYDVLFAMS